MGRTRRQFQSFYHTKRRGQAVRCKRYLHHQHRIANRYADEVSYISATNFYDKWDWRKYNETAGNLKGNKIRYNLHDFMADMEWCVDDKKICEEIKVALLNNR